MAGGDTLLELAAELERRDGDAASALEQVQRLDDAVEGIRKRSDALRRRTEDGPAMLAGVDRAHAQAAAAHQRAQEELDSAERRLAGLEAQRRVSGPELDRARRELGLAREAGDDARARVERLVAQRQEQEAAIAAARAEAPALVREAAVIAAEVATVGRLSESGREPPPERLDGLHDWASRVHAALFVVGGLLVQERERLVREANELGGSVLGEQLAGSSIALVRRRLEEALRP